MRWAFHTTGPLAVVAATMAPLAAAQAQGSIPDQPTAPVVRIDPDIATDFGDADLDAWRASRADACLMVGEQPDSQPEAFYDGMQGWMRARSPSVERMLTELEGSNFALCTGDAHHPGNQNTWYSSSKDVAFLPVDGRSMGVFLSGVAEEIRHGWQDHLGLMAEAPGGDSQQSKMATVLMLEADGAAFAVHTAYELGLQGEVDAWNAVARNTAHGPMAQAYLDSLKDAGVTPGEPATAAQYQDAMRAAYRTFMTLEQPRDFYQSLHQTTLDGLPHSTRPMAGEVAVITERLAALPAGDRPDVYLGDAEVRLAVETAFDQIPVPRVAPTLAR
ncbi:MAG: hypothetical protein KI792_09045 [Alphaproteobacteria bacterium]|nr:hypothetical protein [Alphaproteobacteria bacterium SS10]